MQNVIDLLKILGPTNNSTSSDVQRCKLLLFHGKGTVVRTDATIALQTGIIIPQSIAESSPRHLKELITAHEGQSTSIVGAEMNCGIKLMDKLYVEVAVDSHELDQVKLLTQSKSLSKIVHVVPPVIKVDSPLLGIPILVVLEKLMHNSHLHLVPELRCAPTRMNWNFIRILQTVLLPILLLPPVHWKSHTLLGSRRLLTAGWLGGNHHLMLCLSVIRTRTSAGSLPGLQARIGARTRATCTHTREAHKIPSKDERNVHKNKEYIKCK